MKLKYMITAVGSIYSGVGASHLDRDRFGVRSSTSSLAEQEDKNRKFSAIIMKCFNRRV